MQDANSFDPYHKWLGIAPGEARTHYRLLGLRDFEDDDDVIQAAADRQMTYVKTYATGRNAALSQKLLNELAAAKVCLLNPQRKSEYDAGLKRKENKPRPAAKRRAATASTPAASVLPAREKSESTDAALTGLFAAASSPASTASRSPNQGVRREKKRSNSTTVMAIAGGAVVALVCLIAIIVVMSGGDTEPTADVGGPVDVGRNGLGGGQTTGQTDDGGDTDVDDEHDENGNSTESGRSEERTVQKLVIEPIADQSVAPGCALRFKVAARDGFGHELGLQYRLMNDADRGEINPINGQFQWQSRAEDRGQRFDVTVAVVDAQGNSAERSFAVHVKDELEHPPDPVVWLSFDSDTVESFAEGKYFEDKSGNGLSGRMVGSPQLVPGVSGTAVACNAPESYVVIPDDPRLRGGEGRAVTVAVWFRFQSERADSLLVSKNWDSGAKDWNISAKDGVAFLGEDKRHEYRLRGGLINNPVDWHHTAFVLDVPNSTLQLYSDGEVVAEDLQIRDASSGKEGNVYLGAAFHNNREFRWGSSAILDELLIYDRALSPEELKAVYLLRRRTAPNLAANTDQPVARESEEEHAIENARTVQVVATPPQVEKMPIPDADALEKARVEIREEYATEFAQEKSVDLARYALSECLISRARTESDPALRYALLDETVVLSTRGVLPETLVAAVDLMSEHHEIPTGSIVSDAFKSMVRNTNALNTAKRMAQLALTRADQAVKTDRLEAAEDLVAAAEYVANRAKLSDLVTASRLRAKDVRALQVHLDRYEKAKDILRGDPQNGSACLLAGKYLCFCQGRWSEGLPYLATSDDDELNALAERELSSPPSHDAQIELADQWWQYAASGDRIFRSHLRARAQHWYQQALSAVQGPARERLLNRLADVSASGGTTAAGRIVETANRAFRIPLNGLAGGQWMDPVKHSARWAAPQVFAQMIGTGELEYDTLPICWFVMDIDFTILAPSNFTLSFGEGSGVYMVIDFHYDSGKRKMVCNRHEIRQGAHWGNDRHYDVGDRVRLKFFCGEGQQVMIHQQQKPQGCGVWPNLLKFTIRSHDAKSQVRIDHCFFRPLTEDDTTEHGWTYPQRNVACTPSQTVVRLYERMKTLGVRPQPEDSFLVGTTSTPMQWIAPGEIIVGSHDNWWDSEHKHRVRLTHGYWIGQYEITQREWEKLMENNPSLVRGSPFLPVTWVRWSDAMEFCARLNRQEARSRRLPGGYHYRLPTDAEWEYACRANTTDEFSVDRSQFWYSGTSGRRLHEVGTSAPNAWGLYDMHGNVAEWCLDRWHDAPKDDGQVHVNPFTAGNPSKDSFVIRGGAYYMGDGFCRSAKRDRARSVPLGHHGFRIVLAPVVAAISR